MNYDQHPYDSDLARELRDSVSALAARERPPLAAITTRGRAHQRRRIAGFAGLSVAGVAAGAALALGLTGILGTATARTAGTIRTTAFTLVKEANGSVTLTIDGNVLLEPRTLQRDLRQDGIPALVTTSSFCSSHPTPTGFDQAMAGHKPPPESPPTVGPTFTIYPAAIPTGTELSFGFFQLASVQGSGHPGEETVAALIDTNSYTCASTPPPSDYGFNEVNIPGGPK
jgi:hypothetical protein